jgi:hypothetical protein
VLPLMARRLRLDQMEEGHHWRSARCPMLLLRR